MSKVPVASIVEAYEHAYDESWDRKEPPTARELAVFCPDDESPAATEEKLKEFSKLREFQIFGPGGNDDVIDIRKDSTFMKLKEQVRPKLKEMALSDEAYAVAEINRIVWEALKPNLAFRELVTIWHTDRPTYRFIRAILVPRAFDIQEATEIPIAGEKYDYIDVNMRKMFDRTCAELASAQRSRVRWWKMHNGMSSPAKSRRAVEPWLRKRMSSDYRS